MTVTAQGGWDPTTFPELRPGVVALWKAAFGDNTPTDPNTPDGLEISLIATTLMLGFDANTGLWSNSFFRSATGISLDRILDLFAKLREPAVASTATVVFYGTAATVIPAATVVVTADTALSRFATDAPDAIGAAANSAVWVGRIVDAQVGVDYLAQVGGNLPSSYQALGGDTVEDIAAGLIAATIADGFATATPGGVDSSGNALMVFDIVGGGTDSMTFSDFGGSGPTIDGTEAARVPATATETGAIAAVAGTLQDLATPIGGVEGQTNDADAVIGRAEESDDALRARHLQTLFANSARTDGGMRAGVDALEGVEANLVISNRTESPTDAFGRPIGSVENIVLKTDTNPASDSSIASAIARQIPAGIEPWGLRSFGLGTTVDGEIIEVFASDAEQLYLHLGVAITMGEGFPTGDLESAVAAAISTYFDAGFYETSEGTFVDTSAILGLDDNWLRTATNTPINSVTQNSAQTIVITSDVTANPGDVPTLVAADQTATARQIIRVDASRIEVTIS